MLPTIFLAAFILGVVLGVFFMLFGVERGSGLLPVRVAPGDRYPASPLLPASAGFFTLAGLVGFLLTREAGTGLAMRALVALLAGGAGAVLARMMVTRWAIPSAIADEVDERYLLQGHVAHVTAPIGDAPGHVSWDVDGMRQSAVARALDGTPIPAGTDVVIERIEDGVAWVEPWAQVEQRI